MHFSKTYTQLLLTLPPELRDNGIEYRQLKKLINQVVHELASLGLSPEVLHGLLRSTNEHTPVGVSPDKGKERAHGERLLDSETASDSEISEELKRRLQPSERVNSPTRAVYEFISDGDDIKPRLRLWVGAAESTPNHTGSTSPTGDNQTTHASTSADEARVAIFLDSPTSKPSSPVKESLGEGQEQDTLPTEDLLAVSKPISQQPGKSLVWTLQRRSHDIYSPDADDDSGDGWNSSVSETSSMTAHPDDPVSKESLSADGTREIIIPLASDTAFFQLLYTALNTLSAHLEVVRTDFITNLEALTRAISRTARPKSSTTRFQPRSATTDPISPFSTSFLAGVGGDAKGSDLYAWREIFQLYVEAEVFEGLSERDRGERSVEDSEERMALFAERVTARGLNGRRKLKAEESREALEMFLELNVFVLNLKKFQRANVEAARKILKKHTKRTALPFPSISSTDTSTSLVPAFSSLQLAGQGPSHNNMLALMPTAASSLPHILVQAISETLLPIIPHIDDYACLICTSIAFKPIRLGCGHLFCVRCLVKMQKRGEGSCPMCRATTVLQADRTNVDWALLNFMQDWFPIESKAKLKHNEHEAAKEQMEELGFSDKGCIIS